MYYTYILRSRKDGRYYIGTTNNLKRRLNEHNDGKTKFLRNRRPLELVYYEKFNTCSEAYNREHIIKRYKGGEAFKKLITNVPL